MRLLIVLPTLATRRTAVYLTACACLLTASPDASAQTNGVTLLSQERIVETAASGVVQSIETNTGGFTAAYSLPVIYPVCLPPFPCSVGIDGGAHASQHSLIGTSPDGLLEVAARGQISYSVGTHGGVRARTRLVTTFAVTGIVTYTLSAEAGSPFTPTPTDSMFTLSLTRADGTAIRHSTGPTRLADRHELGAGTYMLTVDLAGEATEPASSEGSFDVRLTVETAPRLEPSCTVTVNRHTYTLGQPVNARLTVGNRGPARTIEYKTWLRTPGGAVWPGQSGGADGAFVLPLSTGGNHFDFVLLDVGPALAHGLYEFGCVMLDPHTGEQFDVSSTVFEVQ